MKLNCTTFGVFLLVVAQEKRKENSSLIHGRSVIQLAHAFNNNYIKCGYVPQFVIDHCREMLGVYENSTRAVIERMGFQETVSHPRTPSHLSFVLRRNPIP
ncbi:MAG: hypothetical protein WDZ74_02135 [Candidatus Paceibacterota bacterium]